MDMQGKPFKGHSSGTKTTSDPSRYTNPVKEGLGAIPSDSLAAESVREGGKFSQNVNNQPQVTKNLSTSPDAEARLAEAEWGSDRPARGGTVPGGSNTGSGRHDIAPSYVDPVVGITQGSKPKGKNLTEGGFDDSANNASFTSDIGSKNDPGRQAEVQFEAQISQTPMSAAGAVHGAAGVGAGGQRKTGQPYGALGSDQEA